MSRRFQAVITGTALLAGAVALAWWWPFAWARELVGGQATALITLSAACGYVDATLGMGYGSTLAPLLIILGFKPLDVVPAILASQLSAGALGSWAHHYIGNVDLHPARLAFKISLALAAASVAGSIVGVRIALRLPELYLEAWVGFLVAAVGLITIVTYGRQFRFSWGRITALGILAAFNKGITGGGYGPIIMGGQLLAGVPSKNAVGITTLAETLACVVGVAGFAAARGTVKWHLAPFLIAGAVAAVPFSALTLSVLKTTYVRIGIGFVTFSLGILTLLKTFVFH